jgi:hypothetical protein
LTGCLQEHHTYRNIGQQIKTLQHGTVLACPCCMRDAEPTWRPRCILLANLCLKSCPGGPSNFPSSATCATGNVYIRGRAACILVMRALILIHVVSTQLASGSTVLVNSRVESILIRCTQAAKHVSDVLPHALHSCRRDQVLSQAPLECMTVDAHLAAHVQMYRCTSDTHAPAFQGAAMGSLHSMSGSKCTHTPRRPPTFASFRAS